MTTPSPMIVGRVRVLVLSAALSSHAMADVALFDSATGLVGIPSVAVGGATYVDVTLRHLGDLRFALQGATESTLPAASAFATYDLPGGRLLLPSVTVGCDTYTDVVLQDQGGFTFALAAATERAPPPSPVLTIVTPPANVNAAPGQSATFAVVASGPGPYSYQWRRDGSDIPGASGPTYTTPPLAAIDHGALISVQVAGAGASTESANATLAVASGSPLPVINGDPVGLTYANLGSTPTLRVAASGFAPTYQWRRNGANIAGATATSYTLPALSAADDGAWFSLMVCNAVGCRTSQNAQIRIAGPGTSRTVQLSAANNHSMARREDGSLWVWGQALSGSIGIARPSAALSMQGHPAQAMCGFYAALTDVVDIAGGFDHSLALRSDGTVWASGPNSGGQIGNGSFGGAAATAFAPVLKAPGLPLQKVRSIAAGTATSFAVAADGSAWAWGGNQYHQLGDGSASDRAFAVRTTRAGGSPLTGVRSVRAGGVHTLWLGDDGMVWAAGHNTNGQLGDGTNTSRANPVRVETAAGVALDNVVAIAASATHSLALRSDGSVLGWGTGNFGQIGTGASGATLRPIAVRDAQGAALANVTAIAAGDGTSFFVLANGTVLAAGNNAGGRLGIGSSGGGGAASLVRDAGGNVFGNVVAVSSHFQHTLLLRADGSVWGFGRNGSLNLADGTSVSRNGPVRVQGLAP